MRVDPEAHLLQPVEDPPLRARRSGWVERVHEGLQVARRGHVGVELADAAGGGVARVDVALPARRRHLLVELLESLQREVDLAANLELVG